MENPCPFCGVPLPQWRFRFAAEFHNDPKVLQDCCDFNPDLSPRHALLHVPDGY